MRIVRAASFKTHSGSSLLLWSKIALNLGIVDNMWLSLLVL
jgi:hypothetical protein